VNESLEIEGILRTMFDPRNNLANEVSAQLIMHFGDKVFRTIIPRNIRLAEAPSFGKPVLFHDKESRGALAYLALAGEMIRREEEEREQVANAATAVASGDNGSGLAPVQDDVPRESIHEEPAASDSAATDPAAAHSGN
jgi:chromosome partitioning protein